MLKITEWCLRHAPKDIERSQLYTIFDSVGYGYYQKVVLKKVKLSEETLEGLTPYDLANLPVKKQYLALIGTLYAQGIENINAENMRQYVQWMLDDWETFDVAFTAYVWSYCCLNSLSRFPTHSQVLQCVVAGCNHDTLSFLYDVAESGDVLLSTIVTYIATKIGTTYVVKAIAYMYACGNITTERLCIFFNDVVRIFSHSDLKWFIDVFCSYYWSASVVNDLFEYNYTAYRLFCQMRKSETTGFITKGRVYPVKAFHRYRSGQLRHRIENKLIDLPEVPVSYKVNQSVFCTVINDTDSQHFKNMNKYQVWYESLNEKRKKSLQSRNPVVYNACVAGNYEYIAPILDTLMVEI